MTGGAKTLTLFFINGRPDGILTAEIFGWTGHILSTPRTQIAEALKRKESGYAGVYLLFGEREGTPLAYIGESENMGNRIRNHDLNKNWWTSAIPITAVGNTLDKAQVKYLEARLIEMAKIVNKITLDTRTLPSAGGLTEISQANMEMFLDNVLIVLPALGVGIFTKGVRPPPLGAAEVVEKFEYRVKKHNIYATAMQMKNGEFIVQAGSVIAKSWNSPRTENSPYGRLYAEILKTGILAEQGEHRIFVENYAFSAPSAAASVVSGHPTTSSVWRVVGQHKNYSEWEKNYSEWEHEQADTGQTARRSGPGRG